MEYIVVERLLMTESERSTTKNKSISRDSMNVVRLYSR
jgi:hypothetical protein